MVGSISFVYFALFTALLSFVKKYKRVIFIQSAAKLRIRHRAWAENNERIKY